MLGITKRDKEYRRWLKEHPWVNWSEIGGIWKIPVYRAAYHLVKALNLKEEERDNLLKDLYGAVLDGYEVRFQQEVPAMVFKLFPRIKTELSFAEGATNIEELYTAEFNGWEFPVYIKKRGEDVDEEKLEKNIKFLEENGYSIYDKIGEPGNPYSAEEFLNNDFTLYAVDKFTRTDFSRFFEQEPRKMRRWLVKDECWYIASRGEEDLQKSAEYSTKMGKTIHVYRKPVGEKDIFYWIGRFLFDDSPRSARMWWYWKVSDWTYDVLDTIFDPVQEILIRTGVPDEGIRAVFRNEYKAIARARRGFFDGTRFAFA